MHALSYAWSLQSRDKNGSLTIRSAISENLMLQTKPHSSMFYRSGVMTNQSFTLQDYAFSTLFASVILALTRWPLYMNLPVFHGDTLDLQIWKFLCQGFCYHLTRHIYIQTDTTEIIYHSALRVVKSLEIMGCFLKQNIQEFMEQIKMQVMHYQNIRGAL